MNITVIEYDSFRYFWGDQLVRVGLKMWDAPFAPSSRFINWDWDWNNRVVVGSLRTPIVLE